MREIRSGENMIPEPLENNELRPLSHNDQHLGKNSLRFKKQKVQRCVSLGPYDGQRISESVSLSVGVPSVEKSDLL